MCVCEISISNTFYYGEKPNTFHVLMVYEPFGVSQSYYFKRPVYDLMSFSFFEILATEKWPETHFAIHFPIQQLFANISFMKWISDTPKYVFCTFIYLCMCVCVCCVHIF